MEQIILVQVVEEPLQLDLMEIQPQKVAVMVELVHQIQLLVQMFHMLVVAVVQVIQEQEAVEVLVVEEMVDKGRAMLLTLQLEQQILAVAVELEIIMAQDQIVMVVLELW